MLRINTFNRIKFTAYVPVYDFVGRWFMRARRRVFEVAALKQGVKVLMVGAGTGLDLEVLPPGVACTALDYTPAMLKKLKRRALQLGKVVEVVQGDAAALPFPDDSFDCVTLHFVLEVIPDPLAAIKEAARVVKPGGKISLLDIFRPYAARPAFPRRMLNFLSVAWFSGWNLHPESLLDALPLKIAHQENCAWRGNVRLLLLEKVSS